MLTLKESFGDGNHITWHQGMVGAQITFFQDFFQFHRQDFSAFFLAI
jgi:hypothetical protein